MSITTVQRPLDVEPVLDVVRDRADEADRTGRIPDDVVAAIRRTGLNRALVPAALGGLEASVLEVMDAVERISAADGSTGWCAVIGAGSNLFAGGMAEPGAREVSPTPTRPAPPCSPPPGG